MDKSHVLRCSDWEAPLSLRQVHYAAVDAYVGWAVFGSLHARHGVGDDHLSFGFAFVNRKPITIKNKGGQVVELKPKELKLPTKVKVCGPLSLSSSFSSLSVAKYHFPP